MADETGASGAEEQTGAAGAAQNIGNDISKTFAQLGGGERLAVLGAAVVLAGWLIFDLLIDDYSTGQLGFGLAVLIVGAAYVHHQRSGGADPVPYMSLLFVAGGILGLIGLTDFIEETRDSIFDARGSTIIGALVFYVGAIVSGVGAFQVRGSK